MTDLRWHRADKLPPDDRDVLGYWTARDDDSAPYRAITFYHPGLGWSSDFGIDPTYWTELPAPPVAEAGT